MVSLYRATLKEAVFTVIGLIRMFWTFVSIFMFICLFYINYVNVADWTEKVSVSVNHSLNRKWSCSEKNNNPKKQNHKQTSDCAIVCGIKMWCRCCCRACGCVDVSWMWVGLLAHKLSKLMGHHRKKCSRPQPQTHTSQSSHSHHTHRHTITPRCAHTHTHMLIHHNKH